MWGAVTPPIHSTVSPACTCTVPGMKRFWIAGGGAPFRLDSPAWTWYVAACAAGAASAATPSAQAKMLRRVLKTFVTSRTSTAAGGAAP